MKAKTIVVTILALLAICGSARAQEGRYETIELNSSGRFLAGLNVAVCTTLATTAASVTNNVATLTMASNPQTAGFLVGFSLTVSGFTGGDTYLNVTATIVAVSSTTISFTLVHANASAGTNGIVYMTGSTTQACAPLASLFTDNTGNFTSPNPFVSDGLGNVGLWAAAGPYYLQTYGPTITTSIKLIGIGCVPSSSTATCGVYLNGNNAWTGNETHSGTEGFSGQIMDSFTTQGLPNSSAFRTMNITYPSPRGANQYWLNLLNVADPLVDGSAGIRIINTGNADSYYTSVPGLASGATTPTGFGIDVNRGNSVPPGENNSMNGGNGIFCINWSITTSSSKCLLIRNGDANTPANTSDNPLGYFQNVGDKRAVLVFSAGNASDQEEGFWFEKKDAATIVWYLRKNSGNDFELIDQQNGGRALLRATAGASSRLRLPPGVIVGDGTFGVNGAPLLWSTDNNDDIGGSSANRPRNLFLGNQLSVGLSMANDAGGEKHKRFGATCTTGNVAGNTCTTTYSWTTAFADGNYTPVCWGVAPTGSPVLTLSTGPIAASITVQVQTMTAIASSFTNVYCVAMHD